MQRKQVMFQKKRNTYGVNTKKLTELHGITRSNLDFD